MSEKLEILESGAPVVNGKDRMTGSFAPGNRLSSGNRLHQRMHEFRRSILDSVTPDLLQAVIASMASQGADGDVAAARVFLEYTVGKPTQGIELSGPDGGPLALDVHSMTAVIMTALADDPAARVKVAKALRSLPSAPSGDGTIELAGSGS